MKLLLLLLMAAVIGSCSQTETKTKTKEEIVKETIDSINNAKYAAQGIIIPPGTTITPEQSKEQIIQQYEIKKKNEERRKANEEKRQDDLRYAEMRINELQTELAVQYDKYENIKGVKLLRSSQEREIQIRDQLRKIKDIENEIEYLEGTVRNIKAGRKYYLPDPNQTDSVVYKN
ncbi:MAG TPA: hypothetical protein VGP43_07935 [Chitinophagaceae bacterium]|nr:hypothetical protein [Chitinophagaceae bacterium]